MLMLAVLMLTAQWRVVVAATENLCLGWGQLCTNEVYVSSMHEGVGDSFHCMTPPLHQALAGWQYSDSVGGQ